MLFVGLLVALLLAPAAADAVPVAIFAGTALAGTFLASAITFAINFLLAAALSFVAQALLKPSAPSSKAAGGAADTTDNKITIRQAAAPRQIVYGRMRVGGVYGFLHTTENEGTTNDHLHMIVMVAGHEIESFEEIWINDEAYSVADDLNADGVLVKPDSQYVDLPDNQYFVRFKFHKGSPSQEADPDLMAAAPGVWTATDRLQGIAYVYVRLKWNAKRFAGGVPNFSAVIKGKNDIYDPRDGTTGYSENSALCLANYLCDTTYGLPVDYATGIDETALVAAANACDEDVTLAAGGTEKRYRTDGLLTSDIAPQDIIGKLLGAMHGKAPYDGEVWKIMAGAYQIPALTFTDDDLRAGPKVQTITSRRDLFNAVKGTYTGATPAVGASGAAATRNNYQVVDFPPVVSKAFAALDGQTIFKDVGLPLTTSVTRAQRIAKIDLLLARQQIVATMPCKLTVWRCQAGDTILWTSERYGWTAKPFEVAESKFAVDAQTGALGVDLVLRETSASVYDWSTDEESTRDPAPNTNLPDVFNVGQPANVTATEQLYSTRDGGGVKARVRLAWTASNDAFVQSGGGYVAEYRTHGATDWVPLPQTTATFVDVPDISPGTYDFRLSAVNWAGTRSDPVYLPPTPVAGLSAPPLAPSGLTVNASGGLAIARWVQSPDLDVREGGSIVFRHSSLASGASWADSTTVSEPLSGNSSMAVLPLKAGTYLAKFVDSSGNWSAAASFVQVQASVLTFTGLAGGSLVEHPAFAGALTNCAINDGMLMLGDAGAFDDVADVDALVNFDYTAGAAASGSYAFHATMDLGSVKRCRLTSASEAQVLDVYDDFDSRDGEVDDWPDWDGAIEGDESDAILMVRSTSDNPAGSPTWSAWQRLDSADFFARAFQFRLDLVSTDPSYSVAVSALSVVAEGV